MDVAYKVLVVLLIVVAVGVMITAVSAINDALQADNGTRDPRVAVDSPTEGSYTTKSLIVPLLAGLDEEGTGDQMWARLTTIVLAIPAIAIAMMALLWLIKGLK